ncbi:MAG: hypothetical protein AAF205_07010 [Pseudomonadota bacterium]
MKFLIPVITIAALGACASPNYVGGRPLTPGEVPRDEFGRPVIEAMREEAPEIVEAPPPVPAELTRDLADIPPPKPLPTSPDRPLAD